VVALEQEKVGDQGIGCRCWKSSFCSRTVSLS